MLFWDQKWLRSAKKAALQLLYITIIKFFNMIGLYIYKEPEARTNYIEDFHNSCKAAFSAECSQCYESYTESILSDFVAKLVRNLTDMLH